MDAAARFGSAGLRGYAAGALAVSALVVMYLGGDGGQWEWPASPTTESNPSALPVQPPGTVFPANLAVGPADSRSIEDLIGESARESNLALADAHNLQTAALAALDARDHPGTIEAIVTAAATGRVRALGGSLSEAEMRAVLIVAGWPVELHDQALAVAWCESKWSPYADNGTDRGLFQMSFSPAATLRGSWFAYYGVAEALWSDPVTNARVARWAYERSGWGPWNCKP